MSKWGYMATISKDLAADPGVDVVAFLDEQFDRSIAADHKRIGSIEWEWADVDGHPTNIGVTLDDGTYIPPIENAWFVRGTAEVEESDDSGG